MSMSTDRVRFSIPAIRIEGGGIDVTNYRAILRQTMSITSTDIDRHMVTDGQDNCLWIVCRPSQFARFLIMRHNDGISNRFSELHVELISSREQVDLHVWNRHDQSTAGRSRGN